MSDVSQAVREERRSARQLAAALKPWRGYIAELKTFAAEENLLIEVRNPSAPHYQIACLTGDGVCLIVYPHRTSSSNHHPRVRDENSANKARAGEIIGRLGLWVKNGKVPA